MSLNRTKIALMLGALTLAVTACAPPAPKAGAGPDAATSMSADPLPPVGEYKTSEEHFAALQKAANGGRKLDWAKMPDWSGLWTRKFEGPPFSYEINPPVETRIPGGVYGKSSAKLTPEYQARYDKKIADVAKGVEWDPLSNCLPAGYPRWLSEPFLREIVVTPKQTWWINEMNSEVRRIYTDGRGHVPADEAYPLWEGDSIGFWNGNVLTIHTNNVKEGQYQRGQPDHSDQATTVEELRLINADMMEVRVTVYDPPSLAKPYTSTLHYERVKEPGLRINMWSCAENNNIVKTDAGVTDFVLPGEKGYKDPNKLQSGAK